MPKTIVIGHDSEMPALGLGTWKSAAGEVGAAVREALRLGYRHIDCAPVYGNEREVGAAIAAAIDAGVVRRADLWVTSKLWNDSHERAAVIPALERTLADLGLEYLDLFLVHWPIAQRPGVLIPGSAADLVALSEMPLIETWRGMEQAADAGLARHVGVSNFSARKLAALLEGARLTPAVDQVECHPYLPQNALLEFCARHGIAVTAYAPLGSPDRNAGLKPAGEPSLLGDPVIAAIAAELGATPAQVLIAWALQRGASAIPKSVTPARLAENLAAQTLQLSPGQMRLIAGIERQWRYVTGRFFDLPGGPYSYAALWDET